MGGICGIVYFDGRQITDELTRMTTTLAHRATKGQVINWQQPHVALAQLLPHNTTPQSIDQTDEIVSVADARFDSPHASLASLYTQCGRETLFHLKGDFAVAVWDSQRQVLSCGRDHTATRPLYYIFKPHHYFAFASEIKALLALPFVEKRLRPDKVMRYMAWASYLRPYRTETFYENIFALPPAHWLTVNSQALRSQFCWNLNLQRFEILKSDQDYIAAFREAFIGSVQSRTRVGSPISAHLSGGLDSSSVCAVVHQHLHLPLHTLHYNMSSFPSANEKSFAEAVLSQGNYQHEDVAPLEDVIGSMQRMSRIFDRPDHFTLLPTYHLAAAQAAQRRGSHILLTGHDGDSVVGYGNQYPYTLLKRKDWKALKHLMQTYAQMPELDQQISGWNHWSHTRRYEYLMLHYLRPVLNKSLKNSQLLEAIKQYYQYQSNLEISVIPSFKNIFKKISDFFKTSTSKPIFVVDTDFGFDAAHNVVLADILHEGMLEGTEEFEQVSAHHGHEAAHPFYDKGLIELSMVVPERLKFDNGYRRGPLRHAMKGILPESVRLRMTKVVMNEPILTPLRNQKRAIEEVLQEAKKCLPTHFDLPAQQFLKVHFDQVIPLLNRPDFDHPSSIVRSIHLAVWLLDFSENSSNVRFNTI